MKTFDINQLTRKNIRELKPYSSARDEFKGEARVFLDANENPYENGFNRYPDPLQWEAKKEISRLKGVPISKIFLGNGSDEAIDLLIRAFCEPRRDAILINEPTYGMYAVCAGINAVAIQSVRLNDQFDLDMPAIHRTIDDSTRIIFICSPNNPTGNLFDRRKIIELITAFNGLVVIDEAYIDFAETTSFTESLDEYPNLVVLQTFSKAWGLAGLRVGMAFASEDIISVLNKIKYPYNINVQSQQHAIKAMQNAAIKNDQVQELLEQRSLLVKSLQEIDDVQHVYPSDSNFVLVKIRSASGKYDRLASEGIIVRDRSRVVLCNDCLRITVGTPEENETLITTLKRL